MFNLWKFCIVNPTSYNFMSIMEKWVTFIISVIIQLGNRHNDTWHIITYTWLPSENNQLCASEVSDPTWTKVQLPLYFICLLIKIHLQVLGENTLRAELICNIYIFGLFKFKWLKSLPNHRGYPGHHCANIQSLVTKYTE